MKSPVSLSRRTMLKSSGFGVLALSIPVGSGWVASPASAAPVPVALKRSAWTDLVGQTVRLDRAADLRLDAVDDLTRAAADGALRGTEDAFVLSFHGSAGTELASGIHTLAHPQLGDVELFLSPVDRDGGVKHYEVVVDRTIRIAGLGDPASPVAAAAASGLALVLGTPAPSAAAARRIRVRAKARRAHGRLTASLEFPGGGIKGVTVRLTRAGKLVAQGQTLVKHGEATVRLHGHGAAHLPAGKYTLVIAATDRRGGLVTVERSITLR